ncbi:MAG: DUF1064 domain-containing protein [Lachnospiraceae bacterium]|nr:DUF1064 domain-containing protein [Lachnospiraceae bacterium]
MIGRNKYHNRKYSADGEVFDSKKEYQRWQELKLLEKAGEITELRRQVPFELLPNQREPDKIGPRGGRKPGRIIERKAVYVADFVYKDRAGREVIEDCKGMRTKDYILKRKLLLFRFGIRIMET